MGQPLKNYKPKEVISVLERNGFREKTERRRGDHRYYHNSETGKSTTIDYGRSDFGAIEMNAFVRQTGIPKELWTRGRKQKKGF